MSEFVIPTHDLDAGGKAYSFPVSKRWLEEALQETGSGPGDLEGTLSLRASKSGTDVVLHGSLSADLVAPCARCLGPARVPVREKLALLAVPPGRDPNEGSSEEADILEYTGDQVILDELVRDELLLAIPMIPLCSESCPGMSPPVSESAAQNEPSATDPRLLPLSRIKV